MQELSLNQKFDRLYEKLKLIKTSKKMTLPQLETKIINVDTFFSNFEAISNKLRRESKDIINFFETELSTTSSIKGTIDKILVINGRHNVKQLENVLKRYIDTHVKCKSCGCYDTLLSKENRITILRCDGCKSFSAIN